MAARKTESKGAFRERADATLHDALHRYAGGWKRTSAQHQQDGDYEWMAEFVRGHERLVEIGTGVGYGTLALLRNGHTVTSIDENPKCLAIAERAIASAKFSVSVLKRRSVLQTRRHYEVQYTEITTRAPQEGATLVEGDLYPTTGEASRSVDGHLERWLIDTGPYDGIVCWLIGTHGVRKNNFRLFKVGHSSDGEYRLRVQNYAYELAEKILRPGGVLHIVDRGERLETKEAISDAIQSHRDQAEPTSLEVATEVSQREYTPPQDGGIGMVITPGLSGRSPAANAALNYLQSVRAYKPQQRPD